ncbi:phospholipase a-2-activating protein [Holotrichia oblita]|uniref:Phospholipase a-2-activating protein n=1 Tax=Holotrichia oblita TaxID=644536 RepID=A0ACB9T3I4_HOLOL|nr:phospholipase a-2-activating protein [Holotrichia oblita]
MSKPFKLSCTLVGHSLDVRSVCATASNNIISGSRDKTAKLWKPNGFNTGYTDSVTYRNQKNFVASVLFLEPTKEYPDGLVVTGGNDNVILVYHPYEQSAILTLTEHSNTICYLSKGIEANTFLSSSWDTSAKLWNLSNIQQSTATYSGHTAAVWSVIQLPTSNVVTASADKTIALWFQNGQRFQTLTGHSDCVRGLTDFPELNYFASVSNDATIKLWTYAGKNIETLYGHTNYIYSIARNKRGGDNCFVTSDEDRSVRYWQNGVNVETIHLPSQSVWSVCCLQNGDIVTASSDGVIRIFTQDESRYASEPVLKAFEEEVLALQQQSCQEIGGFKVSDLPGKEALYDPGKKAGQMKMIREPQGVVAYTWVEDGENSHWEKVGDVLGGTDKANEGKTMFEGKPYDFVFSVDVEDGKPPLKLPYNKGDDPYKAAHLFLDKNMLPAVYLDQVVDFILKNAQTDTPSLNPDYVDPFTGGSRYTPASTTSQFGQAGSNVDPFTGTSSYSSSMNSSTNNRLTTGNSGTNADPFTGASSYTTLNSSSPNSFFPQMKYRSFDMGDPKVILNKLKEFNQKTGDSSSKISESMLDDVIKLCTQSSSDQRCMDGLFKLLLWTDDIIFPVIDVIRLALRNEINNALISTRDGGSIISTLKGYLSESRLQNNIVVTLRTLCNFFCHSSGEDLMFNNRVELLETVIGISIQNKNIEVGLSTFLMNATIVCQKRQDEIGLFLLANILPDIVTVLADAEAQFRAMIALGTLISFGTVTEKRQIKIKILENEKFVQKLKILRQEGGNEVESKRKICAEQLEYELSH